jgi:hypothetical protein
VYERTPKHQLCYWCYKFWKAENRFPPIDIVHMYHHQSPRAAGLELARRFQGQQPKKTLREMARRGA